MSTTSSLPDTTSVQSAKPTIVLVHGAWADSSSWAAVIKRLRASGYPVRAIANPLQGLVSDTAYLSSYLATIEGPVVLVGHSYGGALITNVDASAFDLRSLVYVAGFIPTKGHRARPQPARRRLARRPRPPTEDRGQMKITAVEPILLGGEQAYRSGAGEATDNGDWQLLLPWAAVHGPLDSSGTHTGMLPIRHGRATMVGEARPCRATAAGEPHDE